MYESVKKRVRIKCFHKKPWRWETASRIRRAASSFGWLKVKLDTGASYELHNVPYYYAGFLEEILKKA